MLAALLLIALLALMPALRSAPTAVPPPQTDIGLTGAPELPATDAHDASRSIADPLDQLAYDDTPVLPAAAWRPTRVAPLWPEPAAWHGAGTHPRPRLRPPSA
ncbi:hypothetical protein [Xanthomonas sp. WHRI 7945]|nr:hypothetical protein [Xanthomonas campestris pv. campestris]